MVEKWDLSDVISWLEDEGMADLISAFKEQDIDGETLLSLTERMTERLAPTMKIQCRLLKALDKLKAKAASGEEPTFASPPCSQIPEAVPEAVPEVDAEATSEEDAPDQFVRRWPSPYKLPEFPPAVLESLKRKDRKLVTAERSAAKNALVACLVDHITDYTRYPRPEQYHDVMSTLLVKYPFLRDSSVSGYQCLKSSVINKMKRDRTPLTSNETVQIMRAKFGVLGGGRKRKQDDQYDEEESKTPKERRAMVLPSSSEEEDEDSLRQQETFLVSEFKKTQPRLHLMVPAMIRTVKPRSEQVCKMTPSEVVEVFPYLTIPQLLLHEMTLLFGKNLALLAQRKMDSFKEAIITKASKAKITGIPMVINRAIEEEADHVSDLKKNAAVVLIPQLLGEKSQGIFLHDKDTNEANPAVVVTGGPDILHGDEITVTADGCKVVNDDESLDLTLGLALLMAVYWVYGFPYPRHLKRTFSFFDKYIFELKSVKTVPVPVIKFYTDISRENK